MRMTQIVQSIGLLSVYEIVAGRLGTLPPRRTAGPDPSASSLTVMLL
jgi:hypothetical protein